MLGLILTALASFAAGCFVGARVMGGFMLRTPKPVERFEMRVVGISPVTSANFPEFIRNNHQAITDAEIRIPKAIDIIDKVIA